MKSGNAYGKEANDKLKIVKGKDFRKEKTKFKNKTTFSSSNITQEVKSIKLDYDSEWEKKQIFILLLNNLI